MTKIQTILTELSTTANNPRASVEAFKQKTNRAAIGCAPEYCPEEIVYAAGMLPVGLWGGKTSISKAASFFPSFACSLVQSTFELGLRGVYDQLSGVIIPSLCDHLKCFGQDWKVGIPNIRLLAFAHPYHRRLEAGIAYLASEYAHIKKGLEEIGGAAISDEDLNHAIAVYNNHRQVMRVFTQAAKDYPVTISPRIRHAVMKSGYFMDKADHAKLVMELTNELKSQPAENWNGKKIVLSGIMAEPEELLDLFAEYKLAVVADDLAQESRQFRVDVPEGSDPLERLARRWSLMDGCSLLYDPHKERRFLLKNLVQENGADGIVICMMKFCEMEEFDYPIYLKTIEEAGIPLLNLEIDLLSLSLEQARTRIQSFAEMLNLGVQRKGGV
ncbi:MAG: 2-hydroxyacyl-CoA dehydratase subunit D [Solirubrobacterales bacterium]